MTFSESNQLINTLKDEYYRVYGVWVGISHIAGSLMSHCSYLLAYDRDEASKEIVTDNIQQEINHLKTLPDYDN